MCDIKEYKILFLLILIIICIAFLIEALFLGFSFIFADNIECNYLWCEFSTTKEKKMFETECYKNGIKINCSKFPQYFNIT